ncbi:MAG: PD-(D/E)XK nuclease-like domain-containing protein [Lentimicrobium sp.]|nr:PD-(D/E)XK nuclease-like domain-containing protein [Lentimicrobium sp.]
MDNYFTRNEVSNSDLSALKDYLLCADRSDFGKENAYRFGSLIDAMITEPHRINYYKLTCDDVIYTLEEFETAKQMKKAFMADPVASQMLKLSETQKVFIELANLHYGNLPFTLPMRCKFDLWMPSAKFGGDLKSTAAATQAQFEDAVRHFDYDRQRAVYMTLSGAEKDVLIGVSKKNFKVFKIFIDRQSELFKSGMEKFTELAFKWWTLF